MHSHSRFRLLPLILLLGTAVLTPSCAYDSYGPRPYTRPATHYRPAYYYDYHYYPSAGVYFNLYSGYYYYRSGGIWVRARVLPSRIYLGPRDRIHMRIWADKPYAYYSLHRQRFSPPPHYQRDRDRNRFERSYNRSHHEQYLRRYRH